MRTVYLDKERKGRAICERCGRVQRIEVAETAPEQTMKISTIERLCLYPVLSREFIRKTSRKEK
jgi:hypothetical protein